MQDDQFSARLKAIHRHDLDSGIFQGHYVNFELGRFTSAFVYGRYQILEDVNRFLDGLGQTAKVLDLGCGTGHFCRSIQAKGYDVVGLDASKEMLGLARENCPEIPFVEAVSAQLPFADNSFDAIISIELLRYLHRQDISNTYAECLRVLKPGGRLFVTHVNRYAADGYWFFYHLKGLLKRITGSFYHYGYFTTASEQKEQLEQLGFRNIQSWGRMHAAIRIAYKISPALGRRVSLWLESIQPVQNWSESWGRNLAGHLIVTAEK